MNTTLQFLKDYANEGLRTLLLAQKEVDPKFYAEWDQKYLKAMVAMDKREEKVNKVAELIEIEFKLIGSTAIEDCLQDNVSEVISFIKEAGVKLWVLTGDKIETAINIGYSCALLNQETETFIINAEHSREIYQQICDFTSMKKQIGLSRDTALVVGGDQLTKITSKEKILEEFIKLAQ